MVTLLWTNHYFATYTYLIWSALSYAQIDSRRIPWRKPSPTPLPLQQKWAMVTKSSEDKQFCHQMITFSEEKKYSSPNIIKILKLVTKSIFRHQRCTDWWQNIYFVTIGHEKKANLGWRNIRVTKDLTEVTKF